jgi:hypothetical protein
LTFFDERYIPAVVVVNYKFFALPVVVTVVKEWKLDVEFFPKCVLEAFTELLPETFAFNKLIIIVVKSDKYFHDVGVELIKLRFHNKTTSAIFEVAIFSCARLVGVTYVMRLG